MSGTNGKTTRLGRISMRVQLRAFQTLRGQGADPALFQDLEMLRHKDLDLSVKAGALLAFDALILTAGLNPISASPGAPVSLDAVANAGPTWVTMAGVALMAIAAVFCVRAIMIGEDVDPHGIEDDPAALRQRLFAAYCAAIDAQATNIAWASRFTYIGGAAMAAALLWSILVKV